MAKSAALRPNTNPRVLFPPLEPLLVGEKNNEDPRKLQVNSDDESIPFDIYESPCALYASNDVFSPTDVEDFGLCNTTFYGGCSPFDDLAELEGAAASNTTTAPSLYYRLDVKFDYELYYRVGSNETKTLKFLEAVMIDHLAAVLGLKGCNTAITDNSNNNRQRQLQRFHPFSESELEHFVAITSEPLDYYDPDFDTCVIPVSRSSSERMICEPVKGVLTAYLVNNPEWDGEDITHIRSGILKMIRHGMNNDLYVAGNVKQTEFIGQRLDGGDGKFSRSTTKSLNNEKSGGIIGIIFAVLALCLVVLFFVARRVKKNHVSAEDTDALSPRSDQSGALPPTKSGSMTMADSTGSGPLQEKATPPRSNTSNVINTSPKDPPIEEFTFNSADPTVVSPAASPRVDASDPLLQVSTKSDALTLVEITGEPDSLGVLRDTAMLPPVALSNEGKIETAKAEEPFKTESTTISADPSVVATPPADQSAPVPVAISASVTLADDSTGGQEEGSNPLQDKSAPALTSEATAINSTAELQEPSTISSADPTAVSPTGSPISDQSGHRPVEASASVTLVGGTGEWQELLQDQETPPTSNATSTNAVPEESPITESATSPVFPTDTVTL